MYNERLSAGESGKMDIVRKNSEQGTPPWLYKLVPGDATDIRDWS
jgi:hypothetical protein